MAKLMKPVYLQNKGLADISKEGLAPETTDSILAANGTDDFLGEDHLVPPAPYGGGGEANGGAPKNPQPVSKTGGLTTKPGM